MNTKQNDYRTDVAMTQCNMLNFGSYVKMIFTNFEFHFLLPFSPLLLSTTIVCTFFDNF